AGRRLDHARRRREVRLGGGAGDGDGPALEGDAVPLVVAAAADVGGIDQGVALGVEARDEGVGAAALGGLEGGGGRHREGGGVGVAGDVGVAGGGIDGDAGPLLVEGRARAAQEGRIDRGAVGVELGDEGDVVGRVAGRLEGAGRQGEAHAVGGGGVAGDEAVAGGVGGDGQGDGAGRAAEVGREGQRRGGDQVAGAGGRGGD